MPPVQNATLQRTGEAMFTTSIAGSLPEPGWRFVPKQLARRKFG